MSNAPEIFIENPSLSSFSNFKRIPARKSQVTLFFEFNGFFKIPSVIIKQKTLESRAEETKVLIYLTETRRIFWFIAKYNHCHEG
jgi:hypothetical protein